VSSLESVSATETLWQSPALLETEHGFVEAVAALAAGQQATFDGAWGSACALLAAELSRHAPGTLLVVCAREAAVDVFLDDFAVFSPIKPVELPTYEPAPLDKLLRDEDYGARLAALKQLRSGDPPKVVAATIAALLQPAPSPAVLAENSLRLATGERFDPTELARWLAQRGMHSTSAVELPGEYALRGGICDVFAPDWTLPARLEFFDDQVESIRRFDVASQRSLESLDAIEIALPIGPAADGAAAPSADRDHLATWLPADTWVLFIEPDQLAIEAEEHRGRLVDASEQHSFREVVASLAPFSMAAASGLATGAVGASCRLAVDSVERMRGELAQVRHALDAIGPGWRAHVVLPTKADIERMQELLAETELAARGDLHFHEGALHHGFRLPRKRVVFLGAGDLLDRGELRRTARRRLGKAIDSFLDLREGDLVVHLGHGIGRYRGMKLLKRAEHEEEHLEIEFKGGTRIFVPAAKIDLVQKYVGGTKGRPALAQIGGKAWAKQKKAAESAVTDMAAEMLELQAARRARPGIAFQPDTNWQREFDASFPYPETPDQLAAIRDIKADMESPRPMDRLLCGDVGFGKTEVAMRAVFKAVENGYQVAVLTPTTVLCEQHFRTFHERMSAFPLEIAKLSRFCTAAEQRKAIDGLKKGRIDVVIGTHRLASSDVRFQNLGLLIIDEEQRFGVEVKERLKSLRETVDVLTMTATPIPRTLHMSLVGVRDISNLETPPADRVAVETRVTRFDRELLRTAVLRELNRNGQIFFVHNRIEDIELVAAVLRQVVPEARLRIGHGQMEEGELEQVMVDFVAHRFDLLLSTTIIESGLDIPNANTIFIDEAHRYGLADLHQLRGRVGR
jgi:transcription-repair coupling factor (superfamily II helicase)